MDQFYNYTMRHRRRGQRGFTLIELLVVIAVLAILAAIVIFNVVGVTNRGNTSACKTDLATSQTAVDAYYNDHGAKYPDGTTGTDTATPANGDKVDNTKLINTNYLHTAPATQFTYTGVSGTITGAC